MLVKRSEAHRPPAASGHEEARHTTTAEAAQANDPKAGGAEREATFGRNGREAPARTARHTQEGLYLLYLLYYCTYCTIQVWRGAIRRRGGGGG